MTLWFDLIHFKINFIRLAKEIGCELFYRPKFSRNPKQSNGINSHDLDDELAAPFREIE